MEFNVREAESFGLHDLAGSRDEQRHAGDVLALHFAVYVFRDIFRKSRSGLGLGYRGDPRPSEYSDEGCRPNRLVTKLTKRWHCHSGCWIPGTSLWFLLRPKHTQI